MINCKQCEYPLTEFDVEFYKNIRKKDSLDSVKCFDCILDGKIRRALYWREHLKKYAFFYLAPSICMIWIPLLTSLLTSISLFDKNEHLFPGIAAICVFVGSFLFMKDSGIFDGMIEEFKAPPVITGYHYETTFHYDGLHTTGTTKKVTDYESNFGCTMPFIILFTFIFWSGIFWIYNYIIKYHFVCPLQVKIAYKKAKNSVDNASVGIIALIKYNINKEIYEMRIKHAKRKYTYLSEYELEEKLDGIRKKFVVTRIAGKKSILYETSRTNSIVIQKSKKDIVIRKILNNSYPSYVYDEKFSIYDLDLSARAIRNIKRLLR